MNIKIFAQGLVDSNLLPKASADGSNVQSVLQWVFVIAAVISFLVIVIAGFQMIISAGEPQKITKARQTIMYAIVGLIVALSGATIVTFVIGRLT
jgi:hypothetical protein